MKFMDNYRITFYKLRSTALAVVNSLSPGTKGYYVSDILLVQVCDRTGGGGSYGCCTDFPGFYNDTNATIFYRILAGMIFPLNSTADQPLLVEVLLFITQVIILIYSLNMSRFRSSMLKKILR